MPVRLPAAQRRRGRASERRWRACTVVQDAIRIGVFAPVATVDVFTRNWAAATAGIKAPTGLNLNDLGSHIREDRPHNRTSDDPTEIDHPVAFEGQRRVMRTED